MIKEFEEMYVEAKKAYDFAYAPYSNFKVGASLLLKNGKIINGCNVENASYGLTNCAERTTLFKAISMGYKKDDFVSLLILANTSKPVSPCGACRQVMSELLPSDTLIILTNLNKDYLEVSVKDLLPYTFDGGVLDE